MKKLVVLIGLVSMFGCTQILCPMGQQIAGKVAQAISVACSCNETEVVKSLDSVLNSAKICPPATDAKGAMIGTEICGAAASLVTELIANNVVPSAWQCTNATGCIGTVMTVAASACASLFPISPAPVVQK